MSERIMKKAVNGLKDKEKKVIEYEKKSKGNKKNYFNFFIRILLTITVCLLDNSSLA